MRRPNLGHALRVRSRGRIGAALALLVAIAVVVGIVVGTGSSSPKAATDSSGASGTTTVQRRDLVQTDTESGTLSYANPQTVYDRLSGTITWLPSVGQMIKPGQALFKVDGEPVILMDGTTPAYRDLTPSDSAGPDILQLNRDLVDMGFKSEGIVVDDVWQPATTAAVEVFQESIGETPTGTLTLGQIVFLPGDQLVSAVDATRGSTGGSSNQGNPGSSSSASDPVAASRPEFVSLTTGTSTSPTTRSTNPKPTKSKHGSGHKPTSAKTLQALIALLKAEIAELKATQNRPSSNPPSKGGSPTSSNGGSPSSSNTGSPSSSNSGSPSSSNSGSPSSSSGGNASAVLQTTSTHLIVTVDLDATKQSEAKVGEPVTVEMPNGGTVDGRISAVSPVAQSSSNSGNGNNGSGNGNGNGNGNNSNGSGSTIPVTITLSGHQKAAGLDQAAVSVNFAEARANNVLSVPVTALLATAGGGYAVQAAASPHSLIPVTTGLFAAGYVQISGSGIYPGLQVTDSQG